MEKDINIYEIMLEIKEEENNDLKVENELLYGYSMFLIQQNEDLKRQIQNLLDIKKRSN
jgi:hypothetical protein